MLHKEVVPLVLEEEKTEALPMELITKQYGKNKRLVLQSQIDKRNIDIAGLQAKVASMQAANTAATLAISALTADIEEPPKVEV